MSTEDPDQRPDDESTTLSGIFSAVTDTPSVFELLSYAIVGLFRSAGLELGGLSRLLP